MDFSIAGWVCQSEKPLTDPTGYGIKNSWKFRQKNVGATTDKPK